jgi:hypothetical protein
MDEVAAGVTLLGTPFGILATGTGLGFSDDRVGVSDFVWRCTLVRFRFLARLGSIVRDCPCERWTDLVCLVCAVVCWGLARHLFCSQPHWHKPFFAGNTFLLLLYGLGLAF